MCPRCRIVTYRRIATFRYFTYGLSTCYFGFKLACLLSMGHGSPESWVKTLMGHIGLDQTKLTHIVSSDRNLIGRRHNSISQLAMSILMPMGNRLTLILSNKHITFDLGHE